MSCVLRRPSCCSLLRHQSLWHLFPKPESEWCSISWKYFVPEAGMVCFTAPTLSLAPSRLRGVRFLATRRVSGPSISLSNNRGASTCGTGVIIQYEFLTVHPGCEHMCSADHSTAVGCGVGPGILCESLLCGSQKLSMHFSLMHDSALHGNRLYRQFTPP